MVRNKHQAFQFFYTIESHYLIVYYEVQPAATTNSESCDFVLSSLLFSFDATNIEMIFFKFQIIMDFYSNGYILFVLILFRIGIDVLPFSLIPGKILASLFLFSRFLLLS